MDNKKQFIQELREINPELVKYYEGLSHEELLGQICAEVLDLLRMEERVQVFMNECTDLSKTTYTPDVLKGLITTKFEHDIVRFCQDVVEDEVKDKDIANYIREKANEEI